MYFLVPEEITYIAHNVETVDVCNVWRILCAAFLHKARHVAADDDAGEHGCHNAKRLPRKRHAPASAAPEAK